MFRFSWAMGAVAALSVVIPTTSALAQDSTLIARAQERGTLRVGVDQGKPFVFKDAGGDEWQGIFMDVLQNWADAMDVELEAVPTTWGNMVAGLQADQFDVAAALNPTPPRSLAVVFSEPLIEEIGTFSVMKDSGLTTWDEINVAGNTICVMLGAAPDLALTAQQPAAEIVRLKAEPDCQLALTSGRATSFYNAAGNQAAFASENGNINLIFPATPFVRQGTAYAFHPSIDMQSLLSFNIVLETFVNSGALKESQAEWGFVSPRDFAVGDVPAYVAEAGY
jgi:polar amino acid transport system substrate-binding protein